MIYTALKERIPEVEAGIEFLEADHNRIAEELAVFANAVHAVQAEVEISRHALCRSARGFLTFERNHIRGE